MEQLSMSYKQREEGVSDPWSVLSLRADASYHRLQRIHQEIQHCRTADVMQSEVEAANRSFFSDMGNSCCTNTAIRSSTLTSSSCSTGAGGDLAC